LEPPSERPCGGSCLGSFGAGSRLGLRGRRRDDRRHLDDLQAIGLAILVLLFRNKSNINVEELNALKG
jgi:hypothetical protein